MELIVRYKDYSMKYRGHIEETITTKEWHDLARKQIKGEIGKLKIIKKILEEGDDENAEFI